jgi:hypothetical protein
MTLTRLGDLLAEPETTVDWVVEELLPAGGFSVLTAKPKVGKKYAHPRSGAVGSHRTCILGTSDCARRGDLPRA